MAWFDKARISSPLNISVWGLLVSTTAAQADVTAQQVWDNWTGQMAIYGDGFTTGGETLSGNTLTVSDVKIALSDEEASVTAALGDIVLTENDDGTVGVTISDTYPITVELTPDLETPSIINLSVSQTGLNLTVAGTPDAMTYDLTADRYAMTIDSVEGGAADEVAIEDATIALRDLSGQYSVSEDDMTRVSYKFDLGALDVDLLLSEIDGEGIIEATADIADIFAFADLALPTDLDLEADYPPFDDGLALQGGYSFGALRYAFDANADGETASGKATVEAGELGFAFNYDELIYTGGSRGIDFSLWVPNEVPFAIEAAMARYGFDIRLPLSQGEDGPRDARFAFNFTDLAFNNDIWRLIDPTESLPRDAFTVALGLEAQVTPFFDVMDPDQQESLRMTDVPGELNGVQLTDLTVRGAGAEITGNGALTFDNDDLETFGGFPRPEGTVEFAINGVNGLVDSLIEMGVIPADDALMPRMMLGMFATSVGEDMLTSTIEVNREGHVLANGQRLR